MSPVAPFLEKGKKRVPTVTAQPGLIVVDDSFSLLASNPEAVQILTFPDRPEKIHHLETWLVNRIRSSLVERQSPLRIVGEFCSSKRTYLCRTFPLGLAENQKVGNHSNGSAPAAGLMVVMFERRNNQAATMAGVSEHFGLTTRERETVQFLLEGLTSKEIAQRMAISPNTVKAFIRLVMVKMDVSTRSGIIGKIAGLGGDSEAAPKNGLSRGYSHRVSAHGDL
jgi:DNA-binding CsgD family transcriptional regulator